MKKQLLAILLIACMLLVFCGCNGDNVTISSEPTTTSSNTVSKAEASSSLPESEISSHISSLDSTSTFSTSSSISSSKVIKVSVDASVKHPIMPVGEEQGLNAVISPCDDNLRSVRGSWSISDESVVQFVYNENSNCRIKALKPGTVTLTINLTSNKGTCSDTCTVTVVEPEDLERRISFQGNTLITRFAVGSTETIGVDYSYGFFSIKDEEYKHEFKIADEAIAQISYDKETSSVFVHGLKPGETTLTATVYVGDKVITAKRRICVKPSNISSYPSGTASSFLSSN